MLIRSAESDSPLVHALARNWNPHLGIDLIIRVYGERIIHCNGS